MLRSQPALPPFAAVAKSGSGRTYRSRDFAAFRQIHSKVCLCALSVAAIGTEGEECEYSTTAKLKPAIARKSTFFGHWEEKHHI